MIVNNSDVQNRFQVKINVIKKDVKYHDLHNGTQMRII